MKPASVIARLLRRAPRHLAIAALALSATVGAVSAETLIAVPHSGLRVLDPILTTAHITRNHAYMIYDTLVGLDSSFKPQPQMADWTISPDKLVWTFKLRDGLKWHDGTPVTAEDCIASIKRWGSRDSSGQLLMERTASLVATDARTITLTLKEDFAYVLDVLAKPSSSAAFMMPKRIAQTPADTAITEHIGSGPFKFVTKEYQPGVKAVYEKFADYLPRKEPASWLAGGKVVKVDRVEWVTMPDSQTALNAIASGEIDYIEAPPPDLLPLVESNPELQVKLLATLGQQTMGRMNFLHPPFDNPKIRKAALLALRQKDFLEALVGSPKYYKVCGALFGCGTPFEDESGAATLIANGDVAAAKALLKEAGYDGTPIVLLHPTDVITVKTQPVVAAQLLRAAGFVVDLQPMDWQTLVTRRASQKPPAEGGWNMFFTNWIVPEIMTPLFNPMLSGRGKAGFVGWPDDPQLEKLRADFVAAKTPEAQKKAASAIQAHAMDVVNYVPLGEYKIPSVWRKETSGWLESPVPLFWNVVKK
jgi:peptide/nickel transport system substrate-binding protein